MNKDTFKIISKYITFAFIWSILLFTIALIISKNKGYLLKDVVFIESILFILLGILASIGGNPIGLSLQSLGQNNAQFNTSSNLQVHKIEKEKTKYISKTTISTSINTISLLLAGIINIIISFII